ncbi:MAG: hypothetical protein R8J84_06445, partial [Mariprofundales bacterium]
MIVRTSCAVLTLWMVSTAWYPPSAEAGQWDIAGQASLEGRYFPSAPQFTSQKKTTLSPSGTLEPEFVREWNHGNDRLTLTPFARWDANDHRRTHADLREASWLHLGASWDMLVGIGKVFWGVTESEHLVDIINQTDGVEDITGEEKLGQPMVNVNIEQQWGTLNLFVLPGFRTQTFTADNARLHGPWAIDVGNPGYASSNKTRHVDWAARWSRTFGDMDIAISHFQGTSREPRFIVQNRSGKTVLTPYYDQIGQSGLELQLTTDNTLWKAEGITRSGHGKRFYAAVGGFEHTLYGIADSSVDVGLLLEYLYDGRDPRFAPPTIANHDIFGGLRMVLNDTQDSTALLGASFDHHTGATFINAEAERRLT